MQENKRLPCGLWMAASLLFNNSVFCMHCGLWMARLHFNQATLFVSTMCKWGNDREEATSIVPTQQAAEHQQGQSRRHVACDSRQLKTTCMNHTWADQRRKCAQQQATQQPNAHHAKSEQSAIKSTHFCRCPLGT
jgi:hypothetical protein